MQRHYDNRTNVKLLKIPFTDSCATKSKQPELERAIGNSWGKFEPVTIGSSHKSQFKSLASLSPSQPVQAATDVNFQNSMPNLSLLNKREFKTLSSVHGQDKDKPLWHTCKVVDMIQVG